MTMRIRPALRSDIPAIAAIYDDHVINGLASFEYDPPGEEEMMLRYAAITADDYPYLVVEEDGVITGYAYAGSFHPRKAYEKTVENAIYLAPSAQGKGMGKALLGALIEECQKLGFLQMIAVIAKLDPPASIRLHERMGFRNAGTITDVGYKHGQWLDVVYMQRSLK